MAVGLLAALLIAQPAAAITVTSTGDSGACTLRGAITAVNNHDSSTACGAVASGTNPTTINLPANTYAITGQLQIAAGANAAIVGGNLNFPEQTVIDAGGASRVFEVLSGGTLSLSGVEVTGGRTADGADAISAGSGGGAAANGGGILNHGTLTLDHAVVDANFTGRGGRGANGDPNAAGSARYGIGGGAGGSGGGIFNDAGATLTITNSTISGNGTGAGGTGGNGAAGRHGTGAFAYGSDGGAGGVPGVGGGIANKGTATISKTTVSGNSTGRGGAGGDGGPGAGEPADGGSAGIGGQGGDGGSASFSRYEYTGGFELFFSGGGGGIATYAAATLTMSASTISGNGTGAGGIAGAAGPGGQRNDGYFQCCSKAGYGGSGGLGGGLLSDNSSTTLTNVTISGNSTGDGGTGGGGTASGAGGPGPGGYGGYGGGIFASGARSPYFLNLTHVTVANNGLGAAGSRGAGTGTPFVDGQRGKGGGIGVSGRYDPSGASVALRRSIIAANGNPATDAQCFQLGANPTNFSDGGSNLSYPGTTCPGISQDPLLGALADNGGPTKTQLPGSGSPAIGGVPTAQCTTTTDQRGYPRPATAGASCDIGAVETGSAPTATPTSTSVSSSANPSLAGQSVTYTATVSPIPGGTVTFKDGGSAISGCSGVSLNGSGQATCPVTYGSSGTHSIVASYAGSSSFAASNSATLTQVVNAPPANRTLTIARSGAGVVTSSPDGISCGSSCTASFSAGAVVTLTATPDQGSKFDGWSGGGCSGTGTCQLTLGSDATVTATFSTTEGTPPPPDTGACDAAKAKVATDQSKVDSAAKKLAAAKDKGASKRKIKKLKKSLKALKSRLAADQAAQQAACG